MALTDENLVSERPHLDGVQRRYQLGDWSLSLINGPMAHFYPFAWEAAVFGPDGHLSYSTPLTSDVEVFSTDDEANAFIEKAFAWFREQAVAV